MIVLHTQTNTFTLVFTAMSRSSSSSSSISLFKTTDPVDDTSALAPAAHEIDCVEVEDKKWTDEELMDDARPGRRGVTTTFDAPESEEKSEKVSGSKKFTFGRK